MIIEWLTGIAMQFGSMLADTFPEWEIPDWMYETRDTLYGILAEGANLGIWFPIEALKIALVATAGIYVIGPLIIRLARAVIAHIPQFGGSGG